MKILKRLAKLGGVSLLFLLAHLSTSSQNALAACGRSDGGMSNPADVRVHVRNNAGNAMNNISFNFYEVDGYTSMWRFDEGGYYVDGSATSNRDFTSGDTCAGSGTVVLAYPGNGGNGWALGCTQRTDTGGPGGGSTGNPATWSFRNITMPGPGSWNIPTFQVVNGSTTDVDLVWTPDAPPVGEQGVQGRVYNDANDNRQYDSGEEIIQNPSGACGSYLTVGATVTAGGTTGNLNVCNPDPLFKISTNSGNQRVDLNVPAGWTATTPTFRNVTVPSGSYYSFTIEQWFGIKRNVVGGDQGVQGRVYNDANDNRQYDSGEEIIQNPSGACGSYLTVGATVSAGGTTGYLNVCNPDPLFKISTNSGNQRVDLNVPAGWTATTPTFRNVTVPSGSYYSFTYGEWFGIKRNVVGGDQGVQGRVYNDANDNRQYDSGEEIIQNPSGAAAHI